MCTQISKAWACKLKYGRQQSGDSDIKSSVFSFDIIVVCYIISSRNQLYYQELLSLSLFLFVFTQNLFSTFICFVIRGQPR